MTPNFALSLAQDGIRLLHRSESGWAFVGEVAFDSDNLAAEITSLREAALAIEPSGLRCKVVIPQDQIKFLSVPFDKDDGLNSSDVAQAALEGATPYALDELSFDTHLFGGTLQIAAVARETLKEAADFVAQNQFDPVSFVTNPVPDRFEVEPEFSEDGVPRNASETPFDEQTTLSSETELEDPANVSFVSRRTVPTFRTEPDVESFDLDETQSSGFAEEAISYRAKPRSITPRSHEPKQHKTSNEAHRMTVFGARDSAAFAGRRDSLLRVVAVVVIVSLGIAGFASGFFSTGWNAVFEQTTEKAPELRFAAPLQPDVPSSQLSVPADLPQRDQPARELALSDEDAAVLDALAIPTPDTPAAEETSPPLPKGPQPDDVQAYYAVYGIWPQAPNVPRPSALVDLNDFYISEMDKDQPQFDAVALPALTSYQQDAPLLAPSNPAPAGTQFTLDDRGMVVPTPDGALNPDGVPVFAGEPPVKPPNTLVRVETPGDDLERRQRLAPFRPIARPENLVEDDSGSGIDATRRAELATLRPRMRPQSAQESALAAASLVALDQDGALIRDTATATDPVAPNARAVRTSLRPDARPNNFTAIVARAQRSTETATTQAAVRIAPRTVSPSIPSSASTAREATQRNAINLRKVNLIGVYGTPSSRRALVRLGNGRYQKVAVGDRIDGGRVSAIGESELRYQKSGRAVVLKMPSG